jgi:hypothetical protein
VVSGHKETAKAGRCGTVKALGRLVSSQISMIFAAAGDTRGSDTPAARLIFACRLWKSPRTVAAWLPLIALRESGINMMLGHNGGCLVHVAVWAILAGGGLVLTRVGGV